jgi:hypothetical protein
MTVVLAAGAGYAFGAITDGTVSAIRDPAVPQVRFKPVLSERRVSAAAEEYAIAPKFRPTITWRQLRRPLHLPEIPPGEPCPVSPVDERVDWGSTGMFGGSGIGRGPAYPGLGGGGGRVYANEPRDGWYGGKVFWYVKPEYRGKVLVRGGRVDAPGALRFSESSPRRAPELRIGPRDDVGVRPEGARGVPSGTLFKTEGCYGYQVDGRGFSRVVVFRGVIE